MHKRMNHFTSLDSNLRRTVRFEFGQFETVMLRVFRLVKPWNQRVHMAPSRYSGTMFGRRVNDSLSSVGLFVTMLCTIGEMQQVLGFSIRLHLVCCQADSMSAATRTSSKLEARGSIAI
eukprot:3089397-Amphidinium_carterae.1